MKNMCREKGQDEVIEKNKKFYETEITLPDEEKSSSLEKISELR